MPVETDITTLRIVPFTLGEAIKDKRMWVDTYQRNYSWDAGHIRDLFDDFERTIKQGVPTEHFLGSIVVVADAAKAKVVDGQQRIATTMMLFGAMRDYFFNSGNKAKADAYRNTFLTSVNEDTLKPEPHLVLNTVDDSFFLNRILLSPDAIERQLEEGKEPTRPSNLRIAEGAKISREQVERIVSGLSPKDAEERLTQWKDFIIQRARVIWMTVPDDGTAYSVFETMNDRGLRLSATDLLKNLLFALSKQQDYSAKVQEHWFKMAGTLEATKLKDSVLTYVRHYWISSRTKATTPDLYKTIKRNIRDKDDALSFAKELNDSSALYAGLLNADHAMWNPYPAEIKEDVKILSKSLQLVTVRPLLLSGVERFKEDHTVLKKFFRSIVNWSVRLLVAGKLGSGALEETYGDVARKLRRGKIDSIKKLREELADVIPPDEAFRNIMRAVVVSQPTLQKYYLRTLENVARVEAGESDTEPTILKHNVEHILPKNKEKAYKHLPPETVKAYLNRLGNLTLLKSKDNELIGDEDYATVKRPIFTQSQSVLTSQIAAKYDTWGPNQIIDWQDYLAGLALKAWPIKV